MIGYTQKLLTEIGNSGADEPELSDLPSVDHYTFCFVTVGSALGLETGQVAIFDHRRTAAPIEDRLTTELSITPQGKTVTIVRA